jgi:hypothetical protein
LPLDTGNWITCGNDLPAPDEGQHAEVREISFGLIGMTVVCLVIVSARKAARNDRREFDACLERTRR